MWNDFKAFIARGNVLDLAIGVILGAAFGTVVKTFTEFIIMPFVGLVTGGVDFKGQYYVLRGQVMPGQAVEDAIKNGALVLRYGQLVSDILTFVIIALVMFFIAKAAMGYFAKLAAKSPPPPQEALLAEIRDLLKETS